MTLRIAMTGATGFVGGATLDLALGNGMQVTALTRRPQPERRGVTWIEGALDDVASLDALVADADVVLHIAGVVNAPDRAGFEAGNAAGTRALVDAARTAGVTRFVHVSSLAAREPDLSDYGWSKAVAEDHVMASGLDWSIVRPPAIYGPGDREMFELFRMASKGLILLPPAGRLSIIEVSDLARLLLSLCQDSEKSVGQLYEVDDGVPEGWSHVGFGQELGRAIDRSVRTISLPKWLLATGAQADRLFRGSKAKLTPDRVRYFCHPDWVADPRKRVPSAIWQPCIRAAVGLSETYKAYREKGWL